MDLKANTVENRWLKYMISSVLTKQTMSSGNNIAKQLETKAESFKYLTAIISKIARLAFPENKI